MASSALFVGNNLDIEFFQILWVPSHELGLAPAGNKTFLAVMSKTVLSRETRRLHKCIIRNRLLTVKQAHVILHGGFVPSRMFDDFIDHVLSRFWIGAKIFVCGELVPNSIDHFTTMCSRENEIGVNDCSRTIYFLQMDNPTPTKR